MPITTKVVCFCRLLKYFRSLCRPFLCDVSVVVDSLFHLTPIVCGGSVFGLFCYALLSALSSFAIILLGENEKAGCFA